MDTGTLYFTLGEIDRSFEPNIRLSHEKGIVYWQKNTFGSKLN
jgi:hypothetical protein